MDLRIFLAFALFAPLICLVLRSFKILLSQSLLRMKPCDRNACPILHFLYMYEHFFNFNNLIRIIISDGINNEHDPVTSVPCEEGWCLYTCLPDDPLPGGWYFQQPGHTWETSWKGNYYNIFRTLINPSLSSNQNHTKHVKKEVLTSNPVWHCI